MPSIYPSSDKGSETEVTVPAMTVNTSPWQTYTLWQFAGDDEDRSIATVDREGWERLANPTGQVDVKLLN